MVCIDDSTGPGILAAPFDPLADPAGGGDPGSTAADILLDPPKYRTAGRVGVRGAWRNVDVTLAMDLIGLRLGSTRAQETWSTGR